MLYTTAVTDRCGNKTAYEYDSLGRTTKVESFAALRDENGNVLRDENDNVLYPETPMAHVSYAYNAMGNLTAITRGDGMGYGLTYDTHHNLASIGVTGKSEKLVTYGYKPGSGRVKSVTYANGHVMKATYNGLGQLVAEKWFESEAQAADSTATPIAYYKYVYDNEGNLVRSIDITGLKEYTYMYENGVLRSATECTVDVGEYDIVTSRTRVNTIRYGYDKDGNLTRQDVSATGQTVCYEYPEDGQPVAHRYIGSDCITSHSKTDSFGRKVFEELQLGTGFVSRQFDYVVGTFTDEHKDNNKLKSTPTTNLVSRITFADGRTIEYEYDEEERITRVIDSLGGEWVYTYDALGQLLTEQHKAVGAESYTTVNTMTYDNYGNILTKNGVAYTYDSTWKDLLTKVGNAEIEYDAQGNPTTYFGHALAWEKGRQLKSYDGIQYTYNANGIRTSKTVDGIRHDYILDGTKIVRESWQNGEDSRYLIPLYDNEDNVCGVKYLSACYYFLKNLQGDVIAITDPNGEVVARYTYDAWGKVLSVTDKDGDPITFPNNIANINPYRYRGYYYDAETGLYYLQSRYYDPETGRFINADDVRYLNGLKNIIGLNAITYCVNSPIGYYDPFGKWVLSVGVEGQAAYVLGVYAGFAINIDGKWNVSITYTIGFAIIINIAASIKAYVAYYIGKSNVSQITGWGISVGVSFSAGIHLSGGGAFDVGFTGNPGGSVNVGFGKGVAVAPVPYFETKIGYTGKLWQFNLLTLLKTWRNNVKKSLWFLTLNVVVTKRNGYVEIYLKPLKKTLYIYKGGKIKVR